VQEYIEREIDELIEEAHEPDDLEEYNRNEALDYLEEG